MTTQSELTITEMMNLLRDGNNTESERELMVKTCLHSPSKNIQKKGMEYLYIYGYLEELSILIERNIESVDPSNRLWGLIYRVMLDQALRRDTPCETIQKLEYFTKQYTTKEPELLFLIEIIKEESYHLTGEINRAGNLMVTCQQYLLEIEERIMVSFFKVRINRMNMIYHLKRNELIMARKYAYRSLTMTDSPRVHAIIHMYLGLSYTFETYEKGIYHLHKSLEISKAINFHDMVHMLENNNIPFLSAHFKEVDNLKTTNIGEQAHLELAKGNQSKVIEMLDDLPDKSPFELYYLGKAKEDRSILIKSHTDFIEKQSDYFFSRLPGNALKEL